MDIEAKELGYAALNDAIRSADGDCRILGCLGQRFIAAGMSGKIKTVLQMIAVPMLLLIPAFPDFMPLCWAAKIFLWASLVMTVYSGVEYVLKNKNVFSI